MKLNNGIIEIEAAEHGAELKSVKKNGREYLWCADPKYWGRTSPVLFPFVGSVRDGKYSLGDKEYPMGQHGFARDMDFALESKSDCTATFKLVSSAQTREKYPYDFELKITYELNGSSVKVIWEVKNESETEMHFSIGAHPAFMCPIGEGKQSDYKLKFDTENDISYFLLEKGLVDKSKTYTLPLKEHYADITPDMFDKDALIVEGRQAKEISLCYPDGREYVRVKTTAPLFGLWSPAGKGAPFICIEPWYGRCDALDFAGDLSEREYSNTLKPQETFKAEYEMEFMD